MANNLEQPSKIQEHYNFDEHMTFPKFIKEIKSLPEGKIIEFDFYKLLKECYSFSIIKITSLSNLDVNFVKLKMFREDILKIFTQNIPTDKIEEQSFDVIDNPEHYGGADNPYEVIKVIDAWGLCFRLGNVLKYIGRAGKKDKDTLLIDLKKARKYLNMEIERLEKLENNETSRTV